MAVKIFVNLPVENLVKSMDFFRKLGFTYNPQFTDDTAACMIIADDIYAMLLTKDKFKIFTPKQVSDAKTSTEVLTALFLDSKKEVDRIADEALKAGATEARPTEDYGFMYARSFNDLDGHIWEIGWMDPAHIQSQQPSGGKKES